MFKLIQRSLLVLLVVCLSACGSSARRDEVKSPQAMYAEAKESLDSGSYEEAIKQYEQLIARYPYGVYALQAELDIAYTHYRMRENALAAAAAERFIKNHPNHPNVDYAYYLKGLTSYSGDFGFFGLTFNQDLSERDPSANQVAFNAFKDLITRFPESRYAPDARDRMTKLVDALASNEIHVARYYLTRRAPLAAANRAQEVVRKFPDSPQVEEALGIMIRAYDQLNLPDLKADTERVLRANYPHSRHLAAARR